MYSYGPPHMAVQKQDEQHEHTFSSYVRIRDVVLKTYLGRWTIGKSGERGSGISVLPARDDDDDDDFSLSFSFNFFLDIYVSLFLFSGVAFHRQLISLSFFSFFLCTSSNCFLFSVFFRYQSMNIIITRFLSFFWGRPFTLCLTDTSAC